MFEQSLNPTGHLWLTILAALVPLIALIFMLAVFRITAWLASTLAGIVTILVGHRRVARPAREYPEVLPLWRAHGNLVNRLDHVLGV